MTFSAEGDWSQDKIDESVARGLEKTAIKPHIDLSLGWRPANILEIRFDEYSIGLVIELPFLLLPPSDDPGEHPYSRREQQRLREEFVRYLVQNESQVHRFFHTQLVNFLIDTRVSKKCNQSIKELLRRIPQRYLAGRPVLPVPTETALQVRGEAQPIQKNILDIRDQIKKMKARDKRLTIDKAIKNLRHTRPLREFPWMSHFLDMANDLARRRYVPSSIDHQDFVETPENQKKLSCNLLEPENWDTREITVRILQKEIHAQGKPRYPLKAIRDALK